MANGANELDRNGCEYGRHLKARIENLEEDTKGLQKKLEDIHSDVISLKLSLSRYEAYKTIGTLAMAALVSAVVGRLINLI